MSIRAAGAASTSGCSNQLWDSEYTNLPDFAVTSATTFDPVKPLFGIGTSQNNPFNYPRPVGLTAGSTAGRSRERPREG